MKWSNLFVSTTPYPSSQEEGTTGSDFSPTIFCPPAKKGFYSNVLFKMT